VSSPRVVTGDNQKAHIEQGTEIPYVTPGTANNPATVSFKKAVLRLDVTPQITPDNRIIMTVEIRKDSVGQLVPTGNGGFIPSIDTRNVLTQISVNNGDTAVIGGIYEEAITNSVEKVPFTPRVVKESINALK
jgi:type IV pilus assembly protein PilQ